MENTNTNEQIKTKVGPDQLWLPKKNGFVCQNYFNIYPDLTKVGLKIRG